VHGHRPRSGGGRLGVCSPLYAFSGLSIKASITVSICVRSVCVACEEWKQLGAGLDGEALYPHGLTHEIREGASLPLSQSPAVSSIRTRKREVGENESLLRVLVFLSQLASFSQPSLRLWQPG